jgi:hypothetical protein
MSRRVSSGAVEHICTERDGCRPVRVVVGLNSPVVSTDICRWGARYTLDGCIDVHRVESRGYAEIDETSLLRAESGS